MSQPLLATNRITVAYTVGGKQHKIHAYCIRGFDTPAGVPQVTFRDTVTGLEWEDAAQGLWDAVKELLSNTVPAATALFEELVSLAWIPVASATLTGAGVSAANYTPAQQVTLVLRDTAFKFIRVVVLESIKGYVGHSATGLGVSAESDVFVNDFNGAETLAGEPFQWQVSRGRRYIVASGSVAGLTFDLNDKLKRTRGLE